MSYLDQVNRLAPLCASVGANVAHAIQLECALKGTLQLKRIYCNNRRCAKCPHGPYWYLFRKVKGRTICRYIGRTLPAPSAAVCAETGAGAADDLPLIG